ncbi:MAG: prolyl-tRNA synthetase associated domain-containing protein [Candidatus Pacebacteria bacterium]|nr:prolyl-tRNA synthetase associated domain-containing protein [Candidatus Paceibacterota bacterium]
MIQNIYQILDTNNIEYEKYEHEPVFTVEEADEIKTCIKGAHTKNLFLKNKNASQYFLYVIASHKRADLKSVKDQIGESKPQFGTPEELMEHLGVTPGSVSVLGLIHDTQHRVQVLIDKELWDAELVNAHPNTNTATLVFTQDNFRKFLEVTRHKSIIVEAQ